MSLSKVFRNERLTYKLNIVANRAISENDSIFVRETGLNIRELRVLRLVDDTPGITFVDVSEVTSLERTLTSRIIQKLIRDGFLVRENSKEDARKFGLHTTEAGKKARAKGRLVSDRLERLLIQPLSAEEEATLNTLLNKLGAWVASKDYRDLLSAE
ncbi:MarR family winged helix-turn-helix transcriptional regulator [Marivivens sp. LCG002]|uniref:MarR family winged helix-turn-helix transcriptional regulator n=1 Tax=Marivivens sp. LCG002 TaxID=3051171 RepID=UPI0025554D58|nr:MarR family winged helix-turn-helix transcriptional regulator [Marivivens sp. LCG002]WIV51195.1 MarR family winged helix-turn-helix transcriptional regulator [Marivivens sp. LCG002]